MNTKIYRSINEPIREELSWDERWKGSDNGLITCWEVGREKRHSDVELAKKAEMGELPVLGWKGGADKELKKNEKYGSLNYLAQWQGLRGENLEINFTEEKTLICSRTGLAVTYTSDSSKYSQP